jgi:hypothetical protein
MDNGASCVNPSDSIALNGPEFVYVNAAALNRDVQRVDVAPNIVRMNGLAEEKCLAMRPILHEEIVSWLTLIANYTERDSVMGESHGR